MLACSNYTQPAQSEIVEIEEAVRTPQGRNFFKYGEKSNTSRGTEPLDQPKVHKRGETREPIINFLASVRTEGSQIRPEGEPGEERISSVATKGDVRMLEVGSYPLEQISNKPSKAYAELILIRNTRVMISLLGELQGKLDHPDGARCMTLFREALESAWKVRDGFSREKVLVLSAVEDSVRGRKWREFKQQQILGLKQTLEDLEGKVFGDQEMDRGFRTLHVSGLDVYPSSSTDEEADWKVENDLD